MYLFMQSAAATASQGGAAWMGELERRFGKARLSVCQQIETIRTLACIRLPVLPVRSHFSSTRDQHASPIMSNLTLNVHVLLFTYQTRSSLGNASDKHLSEGVISKLSRRQRMCSFRMR